MPEVNSLTTLLVEILAATTSAIIFSDGGGVYGVSKYGGGNATALNDGFVLARGLAFDGSGTVFVADEAQMIVKLAS
ncbi:mycA [Symbiodinium sp. CCMP2592]|nr:mycA [Symbiodinium sp. CCMP2592]